MKLKAVTAFTLLWAVNAYFCQIATEPVLMMQNTMHTGRISAISIDSLQTVLLTSSADKSARLWDLSDGRLRQVLRPPIGLERIGRLHAAALSPDKRFAAWEAMMRKVGSTFLPWIPWKSCFGKARWLIGSIRSSFHPMADTWP